MVNTEIDKAIIIARQWLAKHGLKDMRLAQVKDGFIHEWYVCFVYKVKDVKEDSFKLYVVVLDDGEVTGLRREW